MKLPVDPRLPSGDTLIRRLTDLFKPLLEQVNSLTEGRIASVHNAQTSAPSTGTYAAGDFIRNSAAADTGDGTAIFGWLCVLSGTPGTWFEICTCGASSSTSDPIHGPFTPPTGSWSWFNQGSNTVTTSATRYDFAAPADGAVTANVRGYVKALSSANFTATAFISLATTNTENAEFGLVLRDSSSGKIQTFTVRTEGSEPFLASMTYGGTTTVVATKFDHVVPMGPALEACWLRLVRASGVLSFYASLDGSRFFKVAADDSADYVSSPNQIGVLVTCNRASGADMLGTLHSWALA